MVFPVTQAGPSLSGIPFMPRPATGIQNKIATGGGEPNPVCARAINHALQACPAFGNKRAILRGFHPISCISPRNKLPFGFTAVFTTTFISAIASRVAAFRRRRRRFTTVRPQLGYRELMDIGIYRGHIDRVASAENEAI
jgi:hypothetical protein